MTLQFETENLRLHEHYNLLDVSKVHQWLLKSCERSELLCKDGYYK